MRKGILFGFVLVLVLSARVSPASSDNVSLLIENAKKGDPKAQYGLAERYMKGEGVEKDVAKAEQWYRKAAEKGVADAQSTLGKMYRNGEGVPKNSDEAAKWYRKAAEQGVSDAQSTLGK
ncbi:MAG TPA: tetratricopeptide repeat protein, partial [Candidatus Deferrimicrobiaceae bacterium]|nr:tetratricopeptide repeat protein [Candidatus Deferrimicrobiaceae bacterium]